MRFSDVLARGRLGQGLAGIGWATGMAFGAAFAAAQSGEMSGPQVALIFSSILLPLFLLLKIAPGRSRRVDLFWPVLSIMAMAVWFVLYSLFGSIDVNAILFHLHHEVRSNRVMTEMLREAGLSLLPFVLMVVSWSRLASMSGGLAMVNRVLPIVLVVANPLLWVGGRHALALSEPSPFDLASHYVAVDPALPPSVKPRNLIHIFVESAEASFLDRDRFGDVAEPLRRLSASGWTATNIDQVEMTGWTLAGHVASTCGVPLFPLGVIRKNAFDLVDVILPDAQCLGDVLAKNGYRNEFLKGASLDFAGTRGFAAHHGYQGLLGFDELQDRFPGRHNGWGLHDEDMLAVAFDEVESLRASGGPFSLMLTTLGGHAPEGFVSPICEKEAFVAHQPNVSLKAFACTNLLVERFIDRLRTAGLLEDTVVVIQSDHLAMRNLVSSQLNEKPRRNLFIVLGAGRHGTQAKPASALDIFPTILTDLGFPLSNGRAGLGRALQGDAPTLVGEFSTHGVDRAINADDDLRDRLWGLDQIPGAGS